MFEFKYDVKSVAIGAGLFLAGAVSAATAFYFGVYRRYIPLNKLSDEIADLERRKRDLCNMIDDAQNSYKVLENDYEDILTEYEERIGEAKDLSTMSSFEEWEGYDSYISKVYPIDPSKVGKPWDDGELHPSVPVHGTIDSNGKVTLTDHRAIGERLPKNWENEIRFNEAAFRDENLHSDFLITL